MVKILISLKNKVYSFFRFPQISVRYELIFIITLLYYVANLLQINSIQLSDKNCQQHDTEFEFSIS